MVSEKQFLANHRNARRSTGPKTPQGKAVSRSNAFRHGLLSEDVVISGEDPEKFAYLKTELEAELNPVGFQEAFPGSGFPWGKSFKGVSGGGKS